ncbi:unc-22 [Symbiodinium natans]|uniref:Carbonic anhydrase n=1 Tax=Symbiodinium natans TaxID=878477 RepID=A0A812Q2K2_9DINO|nr:unc-22 [Symbiodinium natans]
MLFGAPKRRQHLRCTPSGNVMGSLEFCTGALGTKLILVLGHTKCGAINGATKDYLANKGKSRGEAPNALGALLQGLNDVAKKAEEEIGGSPTEEQIAAHAVKVNVFNSMDFLVKNSPTLRSKVESGEVEVEGGSSVSATDSVLDEMVPSLKTYWQDFSNMVFQNTDPSRGFMVARMAATTAYSPCATVDRLLVPPPSASF